MYKYFIVFKEETKKMNYIVSHSLWHTVTLWKLYIFIKMII